MTFKFAAYNILTVNVTASVNSSHTTQFYHLLKAKTRTRCLRIRERYVSPSPAHNVPLDYDAIPPVPMPGFVRQPVSEFRSPSKLYSHPANY
jgi:hypothetical protein